MLKSQIESLLFLADRPLKKKELAKLTNSKLKDVEAVVSELVDDYNLKDGGIKIIDNGDTVQMVTNPENTEIVKKFLKEEVSGELTPASLETLSIIAYRGPITRDEIEQIRGVNCAIILRHLLIKDLIEKVEKDNQELYQVSVNFLRHLGLTNLNELPDYERLRGLEINPVDKQT